MVRAQRLADADDIAQRILTAAGEMEEWVEMKPAAFEDVLDNELSKYEKFQSMLEDGEQKQEDLLSSITVRSELLIHILLS